MTHNSSVNFKLTHFLLWIKGSHQIFNFETFECSGKNLPNHKSVFLQILHHFSVSWNITPLYFFSSDILYFVQKEPINMYTFEAFECSGQNSSNYLCQFWNNRSIPKLQVSFSSNFAPLFSVMKELILSESYKVSTKKVQRSYLSCHWRVIHSLKKNGLAVSNMTWGICWIFTQPLKSLKVSCRWALFVHGTQHLTCKNTEDLSFITLNSDAKFE